MAEIGDLLNNLARDTSHMGELCISLRCAGSMSMGQEQLRMTPDINLRLPHASTHTRTCTSTHVPTYMHNTYIHKNRKERLRKRRKRRRREKRRKRRRGRGRRQRQ